MIMPLHRSRRAVRRVAAMSIVLLAACGEKTATTEEKKPAADPPGQVRLTAEAVRSAGIEIEIATLGVTAPVSKFTGAVEANQQQIHQVTPLVGGRIEEVYARLGDYVRAGRVLATISSPEVAEMHGKLLEAEARLNLAEATLRRTKRLADLGAAAGKDLTAATAEAETARYDVNHLRDALRILGALPERGKHNISTVTLLAPNSGVVTERVVNPGAGVEPGKTLFTIANLSTVWVIANVPESQVSVLRIGAPAEVTSAVLGQNALRGTVTYVDPLMNEATRSARVRIDVANPNNLLKVGMFVEASIVSGGTSTESLTVADDAVKRIGDKTVVFIQTSPTTFAVRDVALGQRVGGRQVIVSGIAPGERVVTKGSFALKSQMLKSEFAESE